MAAQRDEVDFDVDLTPVPFAYIPQIDLEDQFTQEVRLQSSNEGGFRWMTGAYYFVSTGKFDPSVLQLFPGSPIQVNFPTFSHTTAHSIAAFGEVNVDLTSATKLTVGIRDTHERRELHAMELTELTDGTVLNATDVPSKTATVTKPTWRLGLDHKFGNTLVYASYNRGFKSGGFNAGTPSQDAYKPEILDAYELGFKSLISQRFRLNDAIYYYKYSNYQAAFFSLSNIEVVNAAARIYGADVDLEALVTQSFRLNVGAAYSHARLNSFPDATINTPLPTGGNRQQFGSADGNHLPYSPDVSANVGFDYSWNVSGGKLDLDANYYYNGGWYPEADNVQRQKAYELINSSLTWSTANDAYWVRLWGKNLANRAVATQISSSTLATAVAYQAPRTFGLEFGAKFPAVQQH
jgi:iron complex outermembrane receptor protein